jgi:hypothetical protein
LSKIDAAYFTIGTATTTGMGDIHPASQGSRLLVEFQMVVSLFLVVTALGLAIQRFVDRPVRQLAEIAGAPETLRHNAARLEAGRSNEPARKVAGLMRALADDMESGEL